MDDQHKSSEIPTEKASSPLCSRSVSVYSVDSAGRRLSTGQIIPDLPPMDQKASMDLNLLRASGYQRLIYDEIESVRTEPCLLSPVSNDVPTPILKERLIEPFHEFILGPSHTTASDFHVKAPHHVDEHPDDKSNFRSEAVLARELFCDTKAVCCQCGNWRYLYPESDEDTESDSAAELDTDYKSDHKADSVAAIICSDCSHHPCSDCIYTSTTLTTLPSRVCIPLARFGATTQARPVYAYLCCYCGQAVMAQVCEATFNHRESLIPFFNSTCPSCRHDCCDECACFAAELEPRGVTASQKITIPAVPKQSHKQLEISVELANQLAGQLAGQPVAYRDGDVANQQSEDDQTLPKIRFAKKPQLVSEMVRSFSVRARRAMKWRLRHAPPHGNNA